MWCWWCWNSFFPAGRCFLTAYSLQRRKTYSLPAKAEIRKHDKHWFLFENDLYDLYDKLEAWNTSCFSAFATISFLTEKLLSNKNPSGIWSIAFSQSTLHLHTYTSIGGCIRRSVSGFTSSWTTIGKMVSIKLSPSPELGGMQLIATASSRPVSILIVLLVLSKCDSTISFRTSISLCGWVQVPGFGLAESFLAWSSPGHPQCQFVWSFAPSP